MLLALVLFPMAGINGEAINTNCIIFGFTRPGLEPTIYSTRGEHANHYPSGAIDIFYFIYNYSDDNTVAYAGYDLYKLIFGFLKVQKYQMKTPFQMEIYYIRAYTPTNMVL
jgi:hypothetical protein